MAAEVITGAVDGNHQTVLLARSLNRLYFNGQFAGRHTRFLGSSSSIAPVIRKILRYANFFTTARALPDTTSEF